MRKHSYFSYKYLPSQTRDQILAIQSSIRDSDKTSLLSLCINSHPFIRLNLRVTLSLVKQLPFIPFLGHLLDLLLLINSYGDVIFHFLCLEASYLCYEHRNIIDLLPRVGCWVTSADSEYYVFSWQRKVDRHMVAWCLLNINPTLHDECNGFQWRMHSMTNRDSRSGLKKKSVDVLKGT